MSRVFLSKCYAEESSHLDLRPGDVRAEQHVYFAAADNM